jgi:mono/diheme cytochrome c family protein
LRIPFLAILSLLLLGSPAVSQNPDAETFFNANCIACHNIGKPGIRMAGPDLAGVTSRQNREWLVTFMMDPPAMLASGDSYAQELLAAANNVQMIKYPQMNPEFANALLDYIEAESSKASSGPVVVEEVEPFTAEEVQNGRRIFSGEVALENGGPACFSCHVTASLGSWGGGRLGPDLTRTYETLGERAALTGWLKMPASAVMSPIFREHKLTSDEINNLVAFLEAETKSGATHAPSATASFFGAGLFAAAVLLALFGFFWKNRYRATRTPMVERAKR